MILKKLSICNYLPVYKANLVKVFCYVVAILSLQSANAQNKTTPKKKAFSYTLTTPTKEDSLLNRFVNLVYATYDNPFVKAKTTFAFLKVYIDFKGKVSDVSFSDNADPGFAKNYTGKATIKDDVSTLEKYAAIKKFSDITLLFPVMYISDYSQNASLPSKELEGIMKFGKLELEGNSKVMHTIPIIRSSM